MLWLCCLPGSCMHAASNWSGRCIRKVRKRNRVYWSKSTLSEGKQASWHRLKIEFFFISPCCRQEWRPNFSCPGPLCVHVRAECWLASSVCLICMGHIWSSGWSLAGYLICIGDRLRGSSPEIPWCCFWMCSSCLILGILFSVMIYGQFWHTRVWFSILSYLIFFPLKSLGTQIFGKLEWHLIYSLLAWGVNSGIGSWLQLHLGIKFHVTMAI